MVDSRSTSLHRGMRNHPPASVGEEMSQMQSGSYQGEGKRSILGAGRKRNLRRVRESPGCPGGKALQGPSGATSGVRQEVEGEEAMEGSEVRRLRDLWNQDQEDLTNQVLSSLLGGSEQCLASPATFCSAQGKRILHGLREGSSKGGSGLLRRMLGEASRCSQATLQRTEEGRDYAFNAGRSLGERQL